MPTARPFASVSLAAAPTSPATQRSRAGAVRWLAVALVYLSTVFAVHAAAEVVLQSGPGSQCAIAWGQGGLSNQRVASSIDELPFSFSEGSDPGQLEASQTTTVTAVTGGFRVESQGSAGTLFDVGVGEGGSSCSIHYCADGGEPYSVTLGLQAAGDRDRTPTDPATASILASLQSGSGFAPFTFADAFVEGAGTRNLSTQGVIEAGCWDVRVLAMARDFPGSASYSIDLTLGGTAPVEEECEGDVLAWVGGRDGAFAEPENWEPPKVPIFEEGGVCDTALVRGGRNVTIDLAAAALSREGDVLGMSGPRGGGVALRAGRLLVYDSEGLRTPGGTLTLDALSPDLGARSLEIGDEAELFVAAGRIVARHVELGAEGPGELEVVGPGGSFENTGRLGVGTSREGSLLVRQGAEASSAEGVLGEVGGKGSAVVQDAGSLWRVGNLAVGNEYDGSLEVLDGGRVESDQSFVDFALEGDETASATLRGMDAQGNRATWSVQSLQVRQRGSVSVEGGGFLDVAENLFVAYGDAGADELGIVSVQPGGQLAAASLDVQGTMVLSGDALALVTQYVNIGNSLFPDRGGVLLIQGPSTGPQLDGPTDLEIEQVSGAVLENGARANLLGRFFVGLEPDSDARLRVTAGRTGTGEPSVLRAVASVPVFSKVGASSDEPAGVDVRVTGRLVLEGGRIELAGLEHNLQIGRRGILTGRGGTLSIDPPGKLLNRGVIEGGFTLDGSYEQGPGAMVFGLIRSPGGAILNRAARDPLAAVDFPPRAVRKKAPPSSGPFVVTGDAVLDGRMTLQFGNGVAPRAGESFEVLDVAGTVTGDFAEVAIRGLVPGSFAFEPSLAGGKLALTSLTDAVALPAVSVKAKAKLKETAKKGGKVKLKRTGDTSAPLLVTYSVGGTAQSGVDYEALPGTIEIPARKRSATIVVKPLADGTPEGPEAIELELVPNEAFAPGLVSGATIELLSKDE